MSVTRFPSRFGKYILLDRINSGGMAEVYRAKVTGVEGFQRLVAIKCMLPQLVEDSQFTTMFIDEAKLAAQLTHPNIVQIHELGRIGRRLYIAMELVSGHDLRHVIRATHRQGMTVPPVFALYVLAKAAEALDFAHRKVSMEGAPLNLVHRDVSPQNILISYDGDVKVVDFGIAKAEARATETQAGTIKGKFSYMAPEQVAGEDVDRRADIFSLGAVLYEALSGQRLFAGESDMSILDKVARVDIEPVLTFVASGHPELEEVFKKTLARVPAARFNYASELAEMLEPMLIDKRRIFSAKSARAFMQMLYADDITFLSDRMRDFAGIKDGDVVAVAPDDTPRRRDMVIEHNEQVFETDFGQALVQSQSSDNDPNLAKTERNDLSPQETMQFDPRGVPTVGGDVKTELFDQLEVDVGTPIKGEHVKGGKRSAANDAARSRTGHLATLGVITLLVTLLGATFYVAAKKGLLPGFLPQHATRNTSSPATVIVPTVKSPPVAHPSGNVNSPQSPVLIVPQSPDRVATVLPDDPPPPVFGSPTVATPPDDAPAIISTPHTKELRPPVRPTPRRPTPPPSPPPAVEANYGYISIIAIGLSGKVYVDGDAVGFTPLIGQRVKVGKHVIRVLDVQPGGEERREEISVSLDDSRKAPKKIIMRF